MDKKGFMPNDSYTCSRLISDGLEKNNVEDIEQGLSSAYDLFVDHVLEDRHDALLELGRNLNFAYFPNREQADNSSTRKVSYLGQIRALINLCDYFSQCLVPERIWYAVSKSKYSKPILQAVLDNGAMMAKDLCTHASLKYAAQLTRVVLPLEAEGLIKREKYGKNVWYSLTSTGRLVAGKYFGTENINALESILPAIIIRLKGGWQTIDDLVGSIRANVPTPMKLSLASLVLSALLEAGIAEEQDGNWRIPSRLFREKRELVDISKYPEFMSAARLIEKEYEQLRIGGVPDKHSIDKARNILDEMSTKVMASKTKPHALQVRITLERAKCSALDRDWQTTFILMREAEAAAQTHNIDADLLDTEFRSIWSYMEAACIEPQLVQVNNHITCRDYRRIKDALLTIPPLKTSSQRWNSGASLATKLLHIALDMARAFEESQREYEQTIEESFRQRQQVEYEKELAESRFGRWQPSVKTANRMLSVRF